MRMTSSYSASAMQRCAGTPVPASVPAVPPRSLARGAWALVHTGAFSMLSACSTAANNVTTSQVDLPVDSPIDWLGNTDVIPITYFINRIDDSIGSSVQLNDLLGKKSISLNTRISFSEPCFLRLLIEKTAVFQRFFTSTRY